MFLSSKSLLSAFIFERNIYIYIYIYIYKSSLVSIFVANEILETFKLQSNIFLSKETALDTAILLTFAFFY